VTRYIALEPNVLMYPELCNAANATRFKESDGSLLILSCGAEDTASILSSIHPNNKQPPVNNLISILTLCTIPSPESTLKSLVKDILKSGGLLLFYKHVLSPKSDITWWQWFWTPLWTQFFDGCRLDHPTHSWVNSLLFHDGQGSIWHKREVR
jgi:hypothetical protein